MINQGREIAGRLETLESENASAERLLEELRAITDEALLWSTAENVVPYPTIMEAIFRRGIELGASEQTGRGYLALAHLAEGDVHGASELVGDPLHETVPNPILLSAWSALGESREEVQGRVQKSLNLCPSSLRLWRQYATESLRAGQLDEARRAHLWLLEHEGDPRERERIVQVLQGRGWL